MAKASLQEKLRQRVEPFVEQGERVEMVLPASLGPNQNLLPVGILSLALLGPWWSHPPTWQWIVGSLPGTLSLVVMLLTKPVLLAVTDRRIVVIRAGHLKQQQPRELLEAQPRAPLDPRSGPIWRKVTVGERDYWVNKRFRKELAALDENLRGAAEPPVPASTGS